MTHREIERHPSTVSRLTGLPLADVLDMDTSPWEQIRRREKADAIIDYIWDHMLDGDVLSDETLGLVADAPQRMRDLMAEHVGKPAPSPETWSLVVRGLAKRLDAAKRGARIAREEVA